MATRDDTTLANFELPWIDHREREFVLIYDRPPLLATCDSLTQVARISYGKFDHAYSPVSVSTSTRDDVHNTPENSELATPCA